jgi:hypothetical protein
VTTIPFSISHEPYNNILAPRPVAPINRPLGLKRPGPEEAVFATDCTNPVDCSTVQQMASWDCQGLSRFAIL